MVELHTNPPRSKILRNMARYQVFQKTSLFLDTIALYTQNCTINHEGSNLGVLFVRHTSCCSIHQVGRLAGRTSAVSSKSSMNCSSLKRALGPA